MSRREARRNGSRRRAALRDDDGSYAMELLGFLPAFAVVALFAFQAAVVGGAFVAAENAARTGSRAAAVGIDVRDAAMSALDPGQRQHASVSGGAGGFSPVTVTIDVPIVIPLVTIDVATVRRSAWLPPHTGS